MTVKNLYLIALAALFLAGCGGKQNKAGTSSPRPPANADDAAIRASLTESAVRAGEGDKTVLYENEFSYYKNETPLSKYLEMESVKKTGADSVIGVEFDSVSLMGDSAIAHARMKIESKDGAIRDHPVHLKMYRDLGKWILPYQSRWTQEQEYLEGKRAYDSATFGK